VLIDPCALAVRLVSPALSSEGALRSLVASPETEGSRVTWSPCTVARAWLDSLEVATPSRDLIVPDE
jgi:hypothetical protein